VVAVAVTVVVERGSGVRVVAVIAVGGATVRTALLILLLAALPELSPQPASAAEASTAPPIAVTRYLVGTRSSYPAEEKETKRLRFDSPESMVTKRARTVSHLEPIP
jgi:hypothetical protein